MILKQNGIWGEIMYENVEYDQHFIGEFDVEGDLFNGELIFNKKNGGILIHLTKDVTHRICIPLSLWKSSGYNRKIKCWDCCNFV